MKLIVGLGNPGKKYEKNWHNIGFNAIERFREDSGFSDFKKSLKFKAEIAKGELAGESIILAKPQTFMNDSGLSVTAIAKYFKINPQDIIVIQDDLDLPLGKIRLTYDSSAGGHNGIKSIIEKLNSQKFIRIKIGIRTDLLEKMDSADYVLMNYPDKDGSCGKIIKKTAEAVTDIIAEGLDKAMNRHN